MYQTFFVALGANPSESVADCASAVTRAITDLTSEGCEVRNISPFYRTPCFPARAGPDFVNAAVSVRSPMSAELLLARLHQIEADAGRVRIIRWGQRVIDLDLIAAGDAVLPDRAGYLAWRDLPPERQMTEAPTELILPHPRMHERAFVLVPLMDIAPDWRHPVSGLSVREMCDALSAEDRKEVRRIGESA